MFKKLTEKEKRATTFKGETVFKNKGKEIARVDTADMEQVGYYAKKGADVSRNSVALNISQEKWDSIFKKI